MAVNLTSRPVKTTVTGQIPSAPVNVPTATTMVRADLPSVMLVHRATASVVPPVETSRPVTAQALRRSTPGRHPPVATVVQATSVTFVILAHASVPATPHWFVD